MAAARLTARYFWLRQRFRKQLPREVERPERRSFFAAAFIGPGAILGGYKPHLPAVQRLARRPAHKRPLPTDPRCLRRARPNRQQQSWQEQSRFWRTWSCLLVGFSLMRISCVADALGKSACGLAEDSGPWRGDPKNHCPACTSTLHVTCGNEMRWSRD